jgi:hypothetical protein
LHAGTRGAALSRERYRGQKQCLRKPIIIAAGVGSISRIVTGLLHRLGFDIGMVRASRLEESPGHHSLSATVSGYGRRRSYAFK